MESQRIIRYGKKSAALNSRCHRSLTRATSCHGCAHFILASRTASPCAATPNFMRIFAQTPPAGRCSVANATVSSAGLDFLGADPRRPAHLGQIQLHYDHGQISYPSHRAFVGRRGWSVRWRIPPGHSCEACARRDFRLAHRWKHQPGARSDCRSGRARLEYFPRMGSRGAVRVRPSVAGTAVSVDCRRREPAGWLGRIRRIGRGPSHRFRRRFAARSIFESAGGADKGSRGMEAGLSPHRSCICTGVRSALERHVRSSRSVRRMAVCALGGSSCGGGSRSLAQSRLARKFSRPHAAVSEFTRAVECRAGKSACERPPHARPIHARAFDHPSSAGRSQN